VQKSIFNGITSLSKILKGFFDIINHFFLQIKAQIDMIFAAKN
jgi:hypothetical protein